MKKRLLYFILFLLIPYAVWSQAAASSNYATQTGTLGSTYSWIDCTGGTSIVFGDDAQASFSWPFNFSYYDNTYTTANSISVSTNGFIRLDGTASTDYGVAQNYTLSSTSTELGQIIATSVYDCNVFSGWVRYLVTGTAPNRILTIEYNNLNIPYDSYNVADVQVSFYETLNIVVLKLGADNITQSGVDMGLHSGISGYYNKWQEVLSGTNNTWIEYTRTSAPPPPSGPQASWNYGTQTGTIGPTTYDWIDCSSGSGIVTGDDAQATINWPFNFNFYDNSYTTANSLSLATNGFIRLDGIASTDYNQASAYDLMETATNLGQIIAMCVYDDNLGDNGSWARSLVTGSPPNRIFTIEYNNLEIDYNDNKYADIQVSFYESSNKIVLKFGLTDDVTQSGADIGIHSGVSGYFNKWQEVASGTNNTWIEYSPPNIEIDATIGTSKAYYPTLKAAFDKINDGTHKGNLIIKVNQSTTESASAVLNASGSGTANYTSVNIYPKQTGLSISGALSAPLIDLNGADNVTFDGRVNATGATADLAIINTSTAGTSTIRFINDATNNTIKYCTVKGSETLANSGIIYFSTTTSSSGNDNNTIDNNNITNAANANRPVNAIYSSGTSGKENSGNIISNNNIYDFLKPATASNGINLFSNTTNWSITGNSFYETTSFEPTVTVIFNVIQVNNTSGAGFTISDNYIGGSEASCGGTWTKTNTTTNVFNAISLTVGTTPASSVQNNTIKNFSWRNAASSSWIAISILAGDVNIGTITGNTIGAATGIESIVVTNGSNGNYLHGIRVASTGTVNVQNNIIGAVKTATVDPQHAFHLTGIEKTNVAGDINITGNSVGSLTTSNSLLASSGATGNYQYSYGIRSLGTGNTIISNNTVSNITNNITNTSNLSRTTGIEAANGNNTITNNTVNIISSASAQTGSGASAAAKGISQLSATAGTTQIVNANAVSNINSTHSSARVDVYGILYYCPPTFGNNTANGNFIHSLSSASSNTLSSIDGIVIYSGSPTCANNIISLGSSLTTGYAIYGIYENSGTGFSSYLYFNSIYLGGTASGTTSDTYGIFRANISGSSTYKDNIFFNNRSGGSTGKHYAIKLSGNTSLWDIDYNDYYAPNGVLGKISTVDKLSLAAWQAGTADDANSLNIDPVFASPGGTNSSNYITSAVLPGVYGTGVLIDFDGVTRANPPKMGALEFSLSYVWQGDDSNDFGTASNWENNAVPPNGADISFAASPANDCYLDQNRTLKNITNTSAKKLVVNANQLTITRNIVSATANQIDATATSSVVIFAGTAAQVIPSGVFVDNKIDGLTLSNGHVLTQNGNITVQSSLILSSGAYTIGANTLTLNGAVSATTGTITGGSSSNIVIGGSGASATLPAVSLNNLTLNRANGITTGGNTTVAGTLTLTNGTLVLGANTLTISGNVPVRTSGAIDASIASSNVLFSNASGITLPASLFSAAIQNLSINGGGITAGSDITVNGVLNLQNNNPSDTKALLDMVINWNDYPGTTNLLPGFNNLQTYILYMGATATTVGLGDVSGVVKRTTISSNTAYTFGNQFTTVNISDATTVTAVTLTIRVGALPGHSTTNDAVKRHYEMVPILVDPENVSTTSNVNVNFHYLDSELNGNVELNLTTADYDIDGGFLVPDEHGRADYDFANNFIGLSYVPLSYFVKNSTHVWRTIFFLREFQEGQRIWNGSLSTDWNNADNWLPEGAGVPTALSYVVIPDAATTLHDPILPSTPPTINTMTIEAGGMLMMGDKTINIQNTMSGGWEDQSGLSDPGTSKVVFLNPGATISGVPVFHDIEIANGAIVTNQTNAHVKISGSVSRTGTGKWYTSIFPSTVEYNKAGDQTVIIPDGSPNYHTLMLSGSGTKTMPATAFDIADEFVLTGNLTATATDEITVGAELEILNSATFVTGVFNHTVGGHFDVGGHGQTGTFTPTTGSTITLNGTGVQNIYGENSINFENLVVDNTAGVDIFTNITVNNTLTLTNGNLNVGTKLLTINGDITKTSGFINVSVLSSLYFGGTTALSPAEILFYTPPVINNLTINRTGGVMACCDFTVNGILNLQSANPSATKGCFDIFTHTLNMGENATTTGIGDVTGIIKREHTFLGNVEYSFGNQHTTLTFINTGTKPGWVSCKVSIGSSPAWRSQAVKREYSFAKDAGTDRTILRLHYLDAELNGAEPDESRLVLWDQHNLPPLVTEPHGKSGNNPTNNWVERSGFSIGYLAPSATLDDKQWGFSYTTAIKNTWIGSANNGDWSETANWSGGVPTLAEDVLIPAGVSNYPSTNLNSGTLPAAAKTIEIETGASVTVDTYNITIYGSAGAWINNGTFVSGTGTVVFDNTLATISGVTNFYNVTINSGKSLRMEDGCVMRIAGAIVNNGDWHVVTTSNSTVEYNGGNQTVIAPNTTTRRYNNLILSGTGIKTMPGTALKIEDNFTLSGAASATSADSIVIFGNTTIENGSTFATGSHHHFFGGNFINNGTFTPTSGGIVSFNGTSAQTISGSSTTSFDNLTLDNILGVTMASNVNVNNALAFNNGALSVGANTLGINGTISNPSGNIVVSTSSNLNFGGAATITINSNLFSTEPSINNLTINRAGGVTLGNQSMTVNGYLTLSAGTFTVGANTLTLAGNSPTRTSGNINASNTGATLAFTNTAAITLPASVITGNINNLTVNGAGINAGSNMAVNGILSLVSANQSTTVGSFNMGATFTLSMGASATTTGTGDVTGIVKRQHTFINGVEYSFGNQYTNLNFLGVPGGVKPTWVECKITIGTAPSWRSEAINRFYSFAQSGGTDRMIVKLHYLDTELHGIETDETQLVFWDAYDPDLTAPFAYTTYPRNHSGTNTTNNWIQLTGPAINYLATSSTLDVKQWGLSYTNVSVHTWIGLGSVSYPGDWSLPGHWSGGVPVAGDSVLIPTTLPVGNSGYPYRNLLSAILPAMANSIEIQTGASLGVTDFDITVYGDGNAWVNNGSFTPGTGNVIFANADPAKTVLIGGTTNFYNLTITDKTHLHAAASSVTRVAGIFNAISGSVLDFTTNANTVEYNGNSAQTVINPSGDANPGYHDLIISGSGTKTLPSPTLNIEGDITFNATVSATENTLVMNGTGAQTISGSAAPAINNLTISNTTSPVTASVNLNCSGNFTNSGDLDMTTSALAVASAVTNTGIVRTASVSATPLPSGKTWGGSVFYYTTTGGQKVMTGTYNNLTLSNTSGTQTASGNLTVNAELITTSGGTLNMVTYQLLGTLSTITNGGTIQTQNTSSTPIPTGKTWGGTVQYNATTGGQTPMAGTYSTLTLSNTSGTQTASDAIAATTLNTTSGGTFNMVTYALSGLTTLSNLGTLRTQNTSSTPFTSGLSWGGMVIFDGSAGQTLPTAASTFNNLSISNTAGVTADANQTVNGTLNLSVANPDATHGSLDMATYTLFFGADANTIGTGDVTGTITRTHDFATNTIYTYGNANQYVFFPVVAGQTLPTSFSLRVTLLSTAPDWVADATKRLYEIAQIGGVNTKAIFRTNYLDSELAAGVDESLLSFWQFTFPFVDPDDVLERGWSDYDSQENLITFSDANFGLVPGIMGYFKVTIAPTQVEYRTWDGSESTTTWNTATNWTPQGVPTSSLGIVIPDVSSSNSISPDLPIDAAGRYLIIQDGGTLNTVTDAALTLSGNGNVWSLESGGVFNAGNSNVTFDGNISSGLVGISGETDFYDLTIASNTTLRPGLNSYIGIEGYLTNNGVLDAASTHNVIEFKGTASITIPNPNGSTTGYHSLIISGSGTKTFPTPLNIWHDFTNNGTVDAGTGTVTMSNLSSIEGFATTIGGSASTTFYNLINGNTLAQLKTTADISIASGGTLTINAGAVFKPGATNTVGGAGTLTGYGTVEVTRITTNPDFVTQFPIANKTLTNLTVDFEGAGDQTVNGLNYGNLIIESNGTRNVTLEDYATNSAKIGVSGFFEPDLTTTTYTITGSTLEANGTGAQTVPAFNYYNVNVTGDRGGETITLVNGGTIGIAGHSSVSATNATFEITNSTIDLNGSEAQTIDPFSFYNVVFSNTGIKTTTGDLVVYGGFTVNSGSTLNMSSYTLSGTFAGVLNNNGTIKTANTSASPLPSDKTWGGTIEYTGSSAQTVITGTYTNLTMSGAAGGTTDGDITVNGVLNLSHANPSADQGILETGSNMLSMVASATTIGLGDVTGIVKRQHTFADGVEYTFGNEFTSLNFLGVPGGIKPTWVECKITIGTAPTWHEGIPINRYYSFAQSGGNDRMIVKLHYLDSELHDTETDETQLVFWDAYDPDLTAPFAYTTYPRNHNGNDATNNWIQLTGPAINYLAISSTLDVKQWGLSYSNVTTHTWIGLGSVSYPGDWSLPGHWEGGVPTASDPVLIPGILPIGSSGYPSRNLLPVISPASALSIEIESGATLNVNDYDITVSGAVNAWVNDGAFNAGTGNVIFNNGSTSNTATISGTANFYNLTVSDNTKIQPATSSNLGISGTLTAGSGSILDFSANANTIEYKGSAAQTVINPGGAYGYHNLIFSGAGTKTLPATSLSILGDLTVNSAISVTGNTISMAGTSAQIINGTSGVSLNNLTIDNANAAGVTLDAEALATIRGALLINSGALFNIAPARQLTVSGTLTNNGGAEGLVLKSSASGTASLIHNTNNVEATDERYISGAAEAWHFLSSPVSDHEIVPAVPTIPSWVPSGTYGNNTGYDMYIWNEPTNCWIYKLNTTSTVNWTTVHPEVNFVAGTGYLYSVQDANPTKKFFGHLNNGVISYNLTNTSTDPELQGFNLVGNPYPSSVDWKASGWTRDNLTVNGGGNDMWIWNQTANNYGVYNSADADDLGTNDVTRYIAPMQGFFVRASVSGNIVMTNTIRVHDGASDWFKNGSESRSKVRVRVESHTTSGYDEVLLRFGYPSNEAGAVKLFSRSPIAPSLYMTNSGNPLTVKYLTSTEDNPVVPLGFQPGIEGSYTLNVDFDYSDFEMVMLEDKKNNFIQNLKENPQYLFKSTPEDKPERFVLHFAPCSRNINELPASIYYNGNEIILDLSLVDENVEVKIVDMLGRIILQKSLDGKATCNLPVVSKNQIYIVYATTKNASASRKLYVY